VAERPNYHAVRAARREGGELPPASRHREYGKASLDAERAHALVGELLALGVERFQLSGAGEPLLHPEALPLLRRIKKAGRFATVNTNGTLLDEERVDALVAMGLDELRVTTMAGTPEGFVRTHPGSPPEMFERTRRALRALAERKAARGLAVPRVRLTTVVTASNVDELETFAELGAEVRADRVVFNPFDDVEDPGLATLALPPDEAPRLAERLESIAGDLDARGVPHNVPHFLAASRGQLDTRAFYRAVPCAIGWVSARVDVDGRVYPCCRCNEPLGNAFDAGFEAAWRGEAYRRFRRSALRIPERGTPVPSCDCWSCPHFVMNWRVHRRLRPYTAWRQRGSDLAPAGWAGVDG
jgi:MoaA/NifB/PqqE/SkfB family radical SAM enzyme